MPSWETFFKKPFLHIQLFKKKKIPQYYISIALSIQDHNFFLLLVLLFDIAHFM